MTDSIQFREASGVDRDAILALRSLVFPEEDAAKQQAAFWDWEFKNGYAGSGRIFLAETNDQLVGHFAFVPQTYDVRGEVVRGALAVDVMTHPKFRRQKVFSLLASFAAERLREDFQLVTAFQIRKPVLGGMLAGGWSVASQIPVMLRPLSLTNIVRDFCFPAAASASDHSDATQGKVLDSIRPIHLVDFEQIEALLASDGARQRRSAEFLRWRYGQSVHWKYELDGFFVGDSLRAFLVHRKSILRGVRSLAIADVGVASGSHESLEHLVRNVLERGRQGGAGVAAALLSRQHPAYLSMRKLGFVPGPHRFALMLQVFDEAVRSISDVPWSLSWGDTDHL